MSEHAGRTSDVVWQDPPARAPRRVDTVATELRLRPGPCAKIEHHDGLTLMPWWAPLHESPLFETRIVRLNDRLFGPYDVYARSCVPPTPTTTDGAAT